MFRRISVVIFTFLAIGCIEPYQFRIADDSHGIVIEAKLSDQSFADTKGYPSDGRYFYVKLSRTSDVINIRSEVIRGATVELRADNGDMWNYVENTSEPGLYQLLDDDFKALSGIRYKLMVTTPDDVVIESEWQSLPDEAPPMGAISFAETERPKIILDQKVNETAITPYITLPLNKSGSTLHYRWNFTPMWVYEAPLASFSSGTRVCWATSPYYLPHFVLQADDAGGYRKDFPVIDIDHNERILYEFSLLVVQENLAVDHYNFWKEMQQLNTPGGVFALPPFNLKSNYTASSGQAFGFFGVVREQGTRWYFNRTELSYSAPDWLPADCSNPCGPGCPPPACVSCLRYEMGAVTNVKPSWWGR